VPDLHRYNDWEDRLRTYLDRVRDDTFAWGTHDCALFAASCINAMCGVDPAAAFRATYTDPRGAALALREHGQGTLLRTVTNWLGEPSCIHHAKRGDIVMRDARTTGVCVGQFSWFVGSLDQGTDKLTVIPTSSCEYAFTIPFGPVLA
jgi:hypothetical protein